MPINSARRRTAATEPRPVAPGLIPTDGELLMRFVRHGDHDALALVVDRHTDMVWSVCTRLLSRKADAEDAFQATFLILAQKAGTIRACDSVAGWLFRVAQRTALSARRRQKRRREEPLAAEPPTPEVAFPDMQRRQLAETLIEELRGLPERYQTPLIMRYLEGQSRRQIADATDATVATVAGRLVRGKRMLRTRLARRGVSLTVALAAFTGAAIAGGSAAAAPASTPLFDPSTITAGASPAVSQLVQEGVRSMMLASLAKPAAAFAVVAVLGALMLVDPESGAAEPQPGPGLALQAEAPSPTGEAPAIAVEPSAPASPVAKAPNADEQEPAIPQFIKNQQEEVRFLDQMELELPGLFESHGEELLDAWRDPELAELPRLKRLQEAVRRVASTARDAEPPAPKTAAPKTADTLYVPKIRTRSGQTAEIVASTESGETRMQVTPEAVGELIEVDAELVVPQGAEGEVAQSMHKIRLEQIKDEMEYWVLKAEASNLMAEAQELMTQALQNGSIDTAVARSDKRAIAQRHKANLIGTEAKKLLAKADAAHARAKIAGLKLQRMQLAAADPELQRPLALTLPPYPPQPRVLSPTTLQSPPVPRPVLSAPAGEPVADVYAAADGSVVIESPTGDRIQAESITLRDGGGLVAGGWGIPVRTESSDTQLSPSLIPFNAGDLVRVRVGQENNSSIVWLGDWYATQVNDNGLLMLRVPNRKGEYVARVAGKTPDQAAAEFKKAIAEVVPDAVVQISRRAPALIQPQPSSSPPPVKRPSDVIAKGDSLAILIGDESDPLGRLSESIHQVGNDGSVTIRGLKPVKIAGQSVDHAIKSLSLELRSLMPKPRVAIRRLGQPTGARYQPAPQPLLAALPAQGDQLAAALQKLQTQEQLITVLQEESKAAARQLQELQRQLLKAEVLREQAIAAAQAQSKPKISNQLQVLDRIQIEIYDQRLGKTILEKSTVVDAAGEAALGVEWGRVKVVGLTLREAEKALNMHFAEQLREAHDRADGAPGDEIRLKVQVTR